MPDAMHEQCATHMPDAVHVRTDELTNAEPTHPARDEADLSNAPARVQPEGFVYFVHWPEAQFTKVGCSVDSRRWRPFLRRGGVLLGVVQPMYVHYALAEWQMHVDLSACVDRRFSASAEAVPFLGGVGRGFTECYVDRTGREVIDALLDLERRKPNRWAPR